MDSISTPYYQSSQVMRREMFRVQGSGFRVQDSGLRIQGSGFRVQGSGCSVHITRVADRSIYSRDGDEELLGTFDTYLLSKFLFTWDACASRP